MMLFSLFNGGDDRDSDSLSMGRSVKLLWLLLAGFLLFIFAPRILSTYTDVLWFDSLGYSSVFWFEWRAKLILFVSFFLLTFLILKGAFSLFERIFNPYALGGVIRRFDGQDLELAPEKFMRPLAWAIALLWAFLVAATMTARWTLWAMYFNQVASPERDPIFNKPLNFYFFSWPVWQMFVSWLSGLAVLVFLAAGMWALLSYISRLPRSTQERSRRAAFLVTACSLAAVLLTWAARLYLQRYSLLWKGDDIYNGIGYVAARVTLPAYLLLIGVLVVCSVLAVVNAMRSRNLKVFIACIVAPIAVSFASGLVATYVANFVVKPNQLALETPYIKHNISATRKAFALDRIAARDFPAEGSVQAIRAGVRRERADESTPQTPVDDSEDVTTGTLENVRLWDWRALLATLTQTQALRDYYEFPDVDVDRYVINGRLRQVMIAARELNTERLPPNSRNWVNERLIYTHGYGLVMNTASEFTPEGRPRFIVSEMPLRSTAPEINITRPEIYFGQRTNGHVYVKTNQQEFDFARGGQDSYSTYQGDGGIALGSGLRRWALAWSLGDITKIPFSDAITSDTKVLVHRQIQDRVMRIAPFLQLDNDPYIIAGENGKLYWMLDAYTTSLYHPYSTHYRIGETWTNYARNSVKIVLDAYEGTTDFYVYEQDDPIIQTWSKIYPALFKKATEMPADLRAHVRYPETLFRTQSEVYGLYHTEDVSAFFSRNDLWNVARLQDGSSNNTPAMIAPSALPRPGVPGAQVPMPGRPMMLPNQAGFNNMGGGSIEPYFLLTQLPGTSSDEEFLLSVPFTPSGRPLNLSGWLAARSDGDSYGQLALYHIAETRNISAPQQIVARIKQDPELSKLITLWSQQESDILWGNLLVIPIGRGLLYVQPLFLQSTASPLPELRLVVLGTQDKIFYAPTYEEALRSLLGYEDDSPPSGNARTTTTSPTTSIPGTTTSTPPSSNRQQLIQRAARDLADYQTLTSQGKYAEAGAKLESLKRTLETLKQTP